MLHTWQSGVIALNAEDGGVVVLVEYVDGDGGLGNVSHIGGLHPQRVLLLLLMIQWLGECDLATISVNAEHPVGIAIVGEIISQSRVCVDVVGSDGRDHCSHFGAYRLMSRKIEPLVNKLHDNKICQIKLATK